MAKRYEVYAQSVCPNKPYRVNELCEDGSVWGTYTGYYDDRTHLWRLYPTHNPLARGVGKLTKKQISAALVKQIR